MNTIINKRGSILIVALSLITIFAMMAVSLGFRGGIEVKLAKRHLDAFHERYLALAAVNTVEYLIEKDEDGSLDGPFDDWYGEPAWPGDIDLGEHAVVTVTDLESRININYASERLLTALFDIIGREEKLKTETDDLVSAIMYWRGDASAKGSAGLGKDYKKAPFESLDELLLIDDIKREDIERIHPYLTVHGEGAKNFIKVNPNTASPVVLEAVVESIAGNASLKEDLKMALLDYKSLLEEEEAYLEAEGENAADDPETEEESGVIGYFTSEDLADPGLFHLKLELSNIDPQAPAITTQLLGYLTVDSKFFRINVDIKDNESSRGTRLEAVVGYPGRSLGRSARGRRVSRLRRLGGIGGGELSVLTLKMS